MKLVSVIVIVWASSVAADPVPLVFWHGMGKLHAKIDAFGVTGKRAWYF